MFLGALVQMTLRTAVFVKNAIQGTRRSYHRSAVLTRFADAHNLVRVVIGPVTMFLIWKATHKLGWPDFLKETNRLLERLLSDAELKRLKKNSDLYTVIIICSCLLCEVFDWTEFLSVLSSFETYSRCSNP